MTTIASTSRPTRARISRPMVFPTDFLDLAKLITPLIDSLAGRALEAGRPETARLPPRPAPPEQPPCRAAAGWAMTPLRTPALFVVLEYISRGRRRDPFPSVVV